MKKNLLALFAAATAAFASSAVMAVSITNGAPITNTECAVLGDTVKLNLSKNVVGSYECSEANNSINVGACHTSGSRTASITCAVVGQTAATPPVDQYNDPGCNSNNVGQTITLQAPRYQGFRASTTGGSVGAQLLSANCTATTAAELIE